MSSDRLMHSIYDIHINNRDRNEEAGTWIYIDD